MFICSYCRSRILFRQPQQIILSLCVLMSVQVKCECTKSTLLQLTKGNKTTLHLQFWLGSAPSSTCGRPGFSSGFPSLLPLRKRSCTLNIVPGRRCVSNSLPCIKSIQQTRGGWDVVISAKQYSLTTIYTGLIRQLGTTIQRKLCTADMQTPGYTGTLAPAQTGVLEATPEGNCTY